MVFFLYNPLYVAYGKAMFKILKCEDCNANKIEALKKK